MFAREELHRSPLSRKQDMNGTPIQDLAEMCHEESDRFRSGRSGERGYCYELFRRAIADGDQTAWNAVYEQYRRLVGKWVDGPSDRIDERVNCAFAKFWHAVEPQSFSSDFTSIGKVMSYLKTCASSVCMDDQRREERRQLLVSMDDTNVGTGDTTSRRAIDDVVRQQLFALIEQRLKDDQERLVVDASFRVGLAPRQIAEAYPDVFQDAAEVRRVKERVVRRLSNDIALQDWWKSENHLGKRG
jgi:DNA-directed RNA polymerase specialized sigma24 family protein